MPWYKFVLQKARLNKAVKMASGDAPLLFVIPDLFKRVPILKIEKYSLRAPIFFKFWV
jgi:hypothetical protein